jgi:hypothetical protein
VAEEVFDRGARRLGDVGPVTRDRLRDVYTEIAQTLPDDPTPGQYLRLLVARPSAPAAP